MGMLPNSPFRVMFCDVPNLNFADMDKSAGLTKRECEMLVLIADGLTDKAIAEMLSISKNTVSSHRKKLLQKLNASNSANLVKKAFVLGLLT